jgi:type I restriction enzyme M protein
LVRGRNRVCPAGGESEIRRWVLENDYLEAIIALPTNMFYNTGISTYIWVLTNRKNIERKGKVQLIDANNIFHKLRKNLGKKNKEMTVEDIDEVYELYTSFKQGKRSKIFNTTDFGFTQVTILSGKEKDTENVPLNEDVDEYFKREVLPHLPEAKLDRKKDRIGYEIPFTRNFYEYKPPRNLNEIDADLQSVTNDILKLLNEVTD